MTTHMMKDFKTRQAEFDAQECPHCIKEKYQKRRKAEYPTIEECIHAILDDDLDELQKKRQAIKTKYPKPS